MVDDVFVGSASYSEHIRGVVVFESCYEVVWKGDYAEGVSSLRR